MFALIPPILAAVSITNSGLGLEVTRLSLPPSGGQPQNDLFLSLHIHV